MGLVLNLEPAWKVDVDNEEADPTENLVGLLVESAFLRIRPTVVNQRACSSGPIVALAILSGTIPD